MPRLGLGRDFGPDAIEGVVTTIDDFFFESFSAGQMHPMLTTSRTNLVLQSETWNNASWTKNASTVEANQIASPLDLSAFTADLLKEDSANAEHWVRSSNITASLGQTFTMSFYAKAKERTFVKANFLNSGVVSYNVWINLSNGAITSKNANLTVTTELIGSGFYRITLTAQAVATTLNLLVALATGDANDSYAGDGSSGAYVFGAQVEQDNFVSNYIPTVGSAVTVSTTLNDTSNVWDFDGTDIMIAEDPEDEGFWEESYPDGATLPELVLNGDYEDLGSELVASGTFSSFSKDFGDVTISGDTASFVNTGSNPNSRVSLDGSSIVANKSYKIVFDVSRYVVGTVQIVLQGTTHSVDITGGVDTYTVYLLAGSSGDTKFRFKRNGSVGDFDFDVDNISIKQVDPNGRWTLSNTTISDGVLNFVDNTSAAQFALYHDANLLEIGSAYEITLNVNRTSGSFRVLSGAGGSALTPAVSISSSGTQTFTFTNNTNGGKLFLYTDTGENFIGTIDNVTVREYAIQPLDI